MTGLVFGAHGAAQPTEKINLAVPKDRVISDDARSTVLAVAEFYLSNNGEDDFAAKVDRLDNPFTFEQPVEEVIAAEEPSAEVAPIEHDDTSVLKAIGSSFSKQVRGNLSRGANHYLQLEGGNLLKEGASFPARLPEIKGQTFNVTVSEIGGRGYTLQLGEAELYLPYKEASDSAGASRYSDE